MADKKKPIRKSSKKKNKKRISKYDEKFVINGTFEELAKELITPKK